MVNQEVTLLDTEVEGFVDGADVEHFSIDEEIEVEIGEAAPGVSAYARTRFFVVVSVDYDAPTNPLAKMAIQSGDATLDDVETERINESAVFVANEDGGFGAGVLQVDEGTVEDAVDQFEQDFLTE